MAEFFRQSDVILEKIDMAENNRITEESTTMADTKIIAYGEATGHSHFFDDNISNNGSQVSLYKEINQQNPTMVIIKDKTALLKHQDHLHIHIPQGIYTIKRERSYNPFVSQELKKIHKEIHMSYD